MKLHSFIVILGTGIIMIAFLTALFFAKKEKPQYYSYIFAFIILGLLLSANTIASNNYTWRYGLKTRILIEQILTLLQSLMLGLFFLDILKKSIFKEKVKLLLFLSITLQFVLIIIVHVTNIEIRSGIVSSLVLFIFCTFYLRDLMQNKPTLILVQSSGFWLVMGILFSSCISFPVSSLIPFVSKTDEYVNLRFQIFSIYNMSLIVIYLFILKSYICLRHPQNL